MEYTPLKMIFFYQCIKFQAQELLILESEVMNGPTSRLSPGLPQLMLIKTYQIPGIDLKYCPIPINADQMPRRMICIAIIK